MATTLPMTLQFLIVMIAAAINERLQRKLDYTLEEVRVLKEQVAALGKEREKKRTWRCIVIWSAILLHLQKRRYGVSI